MNPPLLSVVVAVKGTAVNLPDILASLQCESRLNVQFCFACAGPRPDGLPQSGNCETLEGPARALVPELWRDGIFGAKANHVALITSQCIPAPDWIDNLLKADLDAYVGIGGTIALSPSCHAAHRAIYLLRFSGFAPSRPAGIVTDIAADNAVYRTVSIKEHDDLLREGFWEPSFHRRFARDGLKLRFDPSLLITYRGQERPLHFAGMRFSHGREYGFSRANSAPRIRRLAWVVLSPLVAPLIFGRVVARSLPRPHLRRALPIALPWLMLFAVAWSLGEARGYVDALLSSGTKIEQP